MDSREIFEATYPEELYKIPPRTAVAIQASWSKVSEAEKELLSKILNSVRLSLGSVQLMETQNLNLGEWAEKPKRLIGFGLSVPGVNSYEVINTPTTDMVLADSLSTLLTNDELKKKLWISLKQLFSL